MPNRHDPTRGAAEIDEIVPACYPAVTTSKGTGIVIGQMRSVAVSMGLVLASTFVTAAQADDLTKRFQAALNERGCGAGPADGLWGKNSAAALARFNEAAGTSIGQPIKEEYVATGQSAEVRCPLVLSRNPKIAATQIPPQDLRYWSSDAFRLRAQENARFCDIGSWDSWSYGDKTSIDLGEEIVVTGTDLARYRTNIDIFRYYLDRMNVEAATTGDAVALADYLMEIARRDAYTRLRPYKPQTWEGTRPDWVKAYAREKYEAEPAFQGALILQTVAASFSIASDAMTAEERETVRKWGRTLFEAVNGARFTSMSKGRARRDKAPDIRAAYSAGFLAWGAAAQDSAIFARGAELFVEGIDNIRSNGTEAGFVLGAGTYNDGLQLKYQNFAYGLITIAAAVLEQNGIPAFHLKGRLGGSLAMGLHFHLSASVDESKRVLMRRQQKTSYLLPTRGPSDHSLAYLAFVPKDVFDRFDTQGYTEILERDKQPRFRGYYGGYFGGFSSCLYLSHPE